MDGIDHALHNFLSFKAVARDVGYCNLVGFDDALVDQSSETRDNHSSGGLCEDALSLRQQLDAYRDIHAA